MQRLYIFLLLCSMPIVQMYAQDDYINAVEDTLTIDVDIFAEEEPLEFILKFDIKQYQKTKYKDEKITAELTYVLSDTLSRTKEIRIQARGAFRRQHCTLPPFWINIKKTYVENETLATTKKIKLVNHCKGSTAYANYVLKEYLTYKLYNQLSPYSFRVRLVKVKYIDTGRKNKVTEAWAFMIEPEKMVAERLNSVPLKLDQLSHTLTDTVSTDRVAMFQYMVGNSDYSIAGRHNVKLLKIQDFHKPYPVPVPYDFDYSGLVNAYYAIPGENLGIESVRERYYMGVCRPDGLYNEMLEEFRLKKPEFLRVINEFEYLNQTEKDDMIHYIEEFYTSIEGQSFINYQLRSTCR